MTSKKHSELPSLCKTLGIVENKLVYYALNVSKNVYEKKIPKSNGGERLIAAPNDELKKLQRKIKDNFFGGFSFPDYVYGLGDNTLGEHAKIHAGNKTLVKIDIRDFYPSISHSRIYDMWVNVFKMNPEAARLLTKLTTFKGRLQQGFPTSSHIAAVISTPLTQELESYCKKNNISFSQYVDDLNFSGENISYKEVFKVVIKLAHKFGFAVKRKKTKVYGNKLGKLITGVSVTHDRIRASKKTRQKAVDALKDFAKDTKNKHYQNRVAGYSGFLNHLNRKDGRKYKDLLQKAKNNSSSE